MQSAEAQQAFQEATLANYTLRAPYDAWVISRNLELGSMPNPGQSVFTLVAANTVWVRGYVDERLAGRLSLGQPVEIILRSNPAQPIPGHIERIEIQSDAVNEERLVDVAFDQVPDNIHLAEQAEVVITTGTLARAVVVPPTAISRSPQWARDRVDGRGWSARAARGRVRSRVVGRASPGSGWAACRREEWFQRPCRVRGLAEPHASPRLPTDEPRAARCPP